MGGRGQSRAAATRYCWSRSFSCGWCSGGWPCARVSVRKSEQRVDGPIARPQNLPWEPSAFDMVVRNYRHGGIRSLWDKYCLMKRILRIQGGLMFAQERIGAHERLLASPTHGFPCQCLSYFRSGCQIVTVLRCACGLNLPVVLFVVFWPRTVLNGSSDVPRFLSAIFRNS